MQSSTGRDAGHSPGSLSAGYRLSAAVPGEEVGAFHAFRRTLGSLIHDQGMKSDRQLSDWLGHGDPAFTVREYVDAMDDGLGDAEFLDELIPVDGARWGKSPPATDSKQTVPTTTSPR
jgi:integrase